ncbi:MAG: amidohydrolase [Oscillospiraceae bacterium]|nr:amidohydrolase [Oscillospiraceae bacterium]
MNENKALAAAYIDKNSDIFCDVSKKIWEYAELSLKEYQSCELYCKVLSDHGFKVEKNIGSMPTAFSGTWGSGKPVIGFLGEFDALSGLSQKEGISHKEEIIPGGSGHGCGHNLLGAGSLAAAFAVKDYLERTGKPGTVIFFGCPGEEGGAGKAFMARDELWRSLDAALTWHPADVNCVVSGSSLACIQKEYIFKGIPSHAASTPHLGRSALDAVQLMNMGVEFMREHMPMEARVHYAITDGGGISPNVVQPIAKVLYMVRSPKVSQALQLQERVDTIALAASMMTQTELQVRFIDGTAETVPNSVLEKVLYENFKLMGIPAHTEEEQQYAQQVIDSYEAAADKSALELRCEGYTDDDINFVNWNSENCTSPLLDLIFPWHTHGKVEMGSTDVGDVSWQTPTGQINAVTLPNNCPGHSWQTVTCSASSLGFKGMLCAGKVLAAAAIDLYENEELIAQARDEFEKRTAEGYNCPIPADAVPTPV